MALPPGLVSRPFVYGLLAVVLCSLLVVGLFTVGRAIRIERRNERREAVRPAVRAALFDRLGGDDPDWEPWIEGLTPSERAVLRDLLDTHLRLLDGDDRERLQPAVAAVGIDEWAMHMVRTGDRYAKLRALSWLAYVDHRHDPALIRRACADDPALQAAGARVMVERAYPKAPARGIALLLDDPPESLSAFGLDTLYELARTRPGFLAEYAEARYERWTDTLLIQVFRVLRVTDSGAAVDRFDWVVDHCRHDSPDVRAAAIRTLADGGWRPELRLQVPIDALTDDPSPAVRAAVYEMLGEWGDAESVRTLARVARREEDSRCRLRAVRALARGRPDDDLEAAVRSDFPSLWGWAVTGEDRVSAR
ncbi:HEAT repeat domain-containing protein [Halalkalicoccus jeotgali]|uniref:HEAT repeat domain-containing protein n=1 Tax=Halalkalicoccus jeotgali (strain DSM 18796 / CECT 7217 / JCM 14584 / KCTC 4019 / B3) TaxID=795797 RepID=D8JAI5_HALJB|nr:HEAT repeat domain-containing protein [Halalkalicoccus jeotgali]ADJ14707.1 hypothetical protein HacjB3_06580 [Halalkalicoccus jeotgali B3]ELY39503.1 hypothetical protein C497_04982 [Halalkalicoccus jeotgali B3]